MAVIIANTIIPANTASIALGNEECLEINLEANQTGIEIIIHDIIKNITSAIIGDICKCIRYNFV
ncbi:hypothetical protein YN1HA_3890 [Sulfurisphaera ohwakuensis]